ncbi:MAG: PLP-dependent aminotransferase family protein [Dehalococcoidia bacterium]
MTVTTPQPFSYQGLFAANAPVTTRGGNPRAKYDFAVAYPDPDSLPLDGLLESLKVALDREGRDLAYYPVPAGLPKLREYVVEKLAKDRNIQTVPEDVALTAGSGEAIAMLIQALTDPGDVLLTEEYVYLGTLRQMRRFGADVRSVRCDSDGIIPEELEATLKGLADEGKKVKFLYTIPTFQNPLGWTMTLERRRKVLEVTRQFGVPVLEDDCYVDLRFEGEDVTSFHSLDDTGQVLYVGSFSKIIAPGMRMGYLVAPPGSLPTGHELQGRGRGEPVRRPSHRGVSKKSRWRAYRRSEPGPPGEARRHAVRLGREFRRCRQVEQAGGRTIRLAGATRGHRLGGDSRPGA